MQDFAAYEDSSAKSGFWGVLARKAKAILEEEDAEFQQNDASGGIRSPQPLNASGGTTQVKLVLIFVFIYMHIEFGLYSSLCNAAYNYLIGYLIFGMCCLFGQFEQQYQSSDNSSRMEHPAIRKGLDRITTSLNHLGDTFEKAFEVKLMLLSSVL